MATCQRPGCFQPRQPPYRFCTRCGQKHLRHLEETGYLEPHPKVPWAEPFSEHLHRAADHLDQILEVCEHIITKETATNLLRENDDASQTA